MINKIKFVDLYKQYLTIKNEIDEQIQNVICDTAFINGKYVTEFENNFAEYIGVKNCIGLSNGTDALFLALKGLGINPGDEIIIPVNTFIATAEAVVNIGAIPVFTEIDKSTYNIDPEKIENKITDKTKGIIPVHLYGQPADMYKIKDIANKYKLKIIEDAAQAHGAVYKNQKIGALGDCACFSFYPGKNLGAFGDAGAVVTDNDELALRIRKLANHGRLKKYEHDIIGYNNRMDGIQGAVLNVKLKYIDKWNKKRNDIAKIYYNNIDKSKYLLPVKEPFNYHVYHLFVIECINNNRDKVIEILNKNNIESGIHYPMPLNKQPAFKHYKSTDFEFEEKLAENILSLPMHPELTETEVIKVCEILNKI